jgi:hypothetical protein
MSFFDLPLYAAPLGKSVSGLVVSKTGIMTLEVATGSITLQVNGAVHTFDTIESHTFTSDASFKKSVFMGIITNGGTSAALWVDEYLDDGKTIRSSPPVGYFAILDLCWFYIPAGETDLDNTIIYRREWL